MADSLGPRLRPPIAPRRRHQHRGETCCGSAGIYNILQPALAREIGDKKAAHILATGATVVATGNPGCMMQIRAHLADAGAGHVRVVHPVELLLPGANAVLGERSPPR